MNLKTCLVFAVAALLALSTGCPPISALPVVMPGEWLFHLFNAGGAPVADVGIVLLEGGTTEDPPLPLDPGILTFAGTLTWMQVSDTFTMSQSSPPDLLEYTGTVFASTHMEGSVVQTAGGAFSGTWTATFLGSP